jgi:hypothetical protein
MKKSGQIFCLSIFFFRIFAGEYGNLVADAA